MTYAVLEPSGTTHLRVLVVHANFAVGAAVSRRLIDFDVVAMLHAGSILDAEQDPAHYDVVVLCPYLSDEQRESVLAGCPETVGPTVVELYDSVGGGGLRTHRIGSAGAAEPVVAALSFQSAYGNA